MIDLLVYLVAVVVGLEAQVQPGGHGRQEHVIEVLDVATKAVLTRIPTPGHGVVAAEWDGVKLVLAPNGGHGFHGAARVVTWGYKGRRDGFTGRLRTAGVDTWSLPL